MLQPFDTPPNNVVGLEKATEWFGGWPTFHDAEVLTWNLDRAGPTLTATIFTFLVDRTQTDAKGYCRRTHLSVVTLRFTSIEDLEMDGFNIQNVLGGLHFKEDNEVIFWGIYGLHARFRCEQTIVEAVTPA